MKIETFDTMSCPFCGRENIEAKPGKFCCPKCQTGFEIDDRGESVFCDLKYLRLPLNGTVCPFCGLVQDENSDRCVYCNAALGSAYTPC